MDEQTTKILELYNNTKINKTKIIKKSKDRDYSLAELTVLSCIDAIVRYDQCNGNGFEWDLNKVLRMIILSSIDSDTLASLKKGKQYQALVDEFVENRTNESEMAGISLRMSSCNYRDDDPVINEFNKNFGSLHNVIRQGHIYWAAKGERLESDLEHTYGTLLLAIGIESEYDYAIDFNKVLETLTVHEADEIIMGDPTEWDLSGEERLLQSTNAINFVFRNFKNKDKYIRNLDNFNNAKNAPDIESEYEHLIDKLEYLLQVKTYQDQKRYDFKHRPDNVVTRSERVRQIIENGAQDVFEVHYEYDKDRFTRFPCLRRILEQSKKM